MSTDTWNKIARSDDYPLGGHLGGKVWDSIIPALNEEKNRVFAPTLKDEHHTNLTGHIEEIYSLINDNDLDKGILVGHSYGGMIITGVASKMPSKIKHLVYVDAALPDPGQSLFDVILSGGKDPLSFAGLEDAAPYVEKLHFDKLRIKNLPKTYILCTQSDFAEVSHVARDKIRTNPEGWNYIELQSSHVPMASMPGKLSKILLDLTNTDVNGT